MKFVPQNSGKPFPPICLQIMVILFMEPDNFTTNIDTLRYPKIYVEFNEYVQIKDLQKELFEKMLDLAEKHDLPVIVHSRKAMQDTYDILKRHDVKGALHCYQGSAEMAQEFVKLGFYMGIGGPITHNNNKKLQ